MKAVITQDKQVVIKDVDTPTPAKGQILVKVVAAGQNPTDWKHAGGAEDGLIVGCDFAGPSPAFRSCRELIFTCGVGVVEALGEGVSSPSKGTRVAGFVHGTKFPGLGSFAGPSPSLRPLASVETDSRKEYVKTEAGLVWVMPDSTSFEDAAAIGGIAMETAVHALFLKLGLSSPFSSSKKPETVLVWAGSTAGTSHPSQHGFSRA